MHLFYAIVFNIMNIISSHIYRPIYVHTVKNLKKIQTKDLSCQLVIVHLSH